MFVKEKFECKLLTNVSLCLDNIESVVLELKYHNCFLLVGVFYRHQVTVLKSSPQKYQKSSLVSASPNIVE